MTRSCSSATIAATATFQLRKYTEITAATRIRKTMRPCSAFCDTVWPQDGPTYDAVTWSVLTP